MTLEHDSGTPDCDMIESLSTADDHRMIRCLELATQAGDRGNTPIGTILVLPNGDTVEASEEVPAGVDPFGHAEVIAVREAIQKFGKPLPDGTTLYTNAEPCFMCAYAIREAKISRVVIDRVTPGTGSVTSPYPILTANNIPRWGPAPEVVWWVISQGGVDD